jgi:phage/plasmid primase-like uncharacterized protein/RecA-family ATPase
MVQFATPLDPVVILSKPIANPPSFDKSLSDLMAEMEQVGLIVKGLPIEDGEIHRVPVQGSKRKPDGWYALHRTDNGVYFANFGNWRTGEKHKWCSRDRVHLTQSDLDSIKRHKEKVRRELEQQYREGAERAKAIWEAAKPADPQHQYLVKKGIEPHGIRLDGNDLIVPVYDGDSLSSIQRITEDGEKRFMKGGKASGGCYQIDGDAKNGVYVCEGFATGATISEATGGIVHVAFNCHNLKAITGVAKGIYSKVTVCGDDDAWTDGNPGKTKATRAAKEHGCELFFPGFRDTNTKPTDFNDLHRLEGLDAVSSILGTVPEFSAVTYGADFDPSKLSQRKWIIQGLLLRSYITLLLAPPGVGKSVFTLMMAVSVCTGRQLLADGLVEEQCNILYINNEDDSDEIARRLSAICQYHQIPFSELKDRFFSFSGYGDSFRIAVKQKDGSIKDEPDVEKLTRFCIKHNIRMVVVDPFISTHNAPENDNSDVEKVITIFRKIAKDIRAAIVLVHHTPKTNGNSEMHAGNADSGRGASSLLGAVRITATLAKVSGDSETGKKVDPGLVNRLVRMDDAKSNQSLTSHSTKHYKLETVKIANGDEVGVPVKFDLSEYCRKKDEAEAEAKADEKEEDRAETLRARATDIASCMESEQQHQTELMGLYMAQMDIKESTAKGHLAGLPASKGNAIEIEIEGETFCLWRENLAKNGMYRYLVHKVAKADMNMEPEPETVTDGEGQEDV